MYTSLIFNDRLYVGTNQGLFVFDKKADKFNKIAKTEGQVWKLRVIDNTLFCCHTNGVFQIDDSKARRLEATKGTWDIKTIPGNPDLLITGTYEGLVLLSKKRNNKWQFYKRIQGLNFSSRFFEFLSIDKLLVSHGYKGLFTYQLASNYNSIELLYKQQHKGVGATIFPFKGGIKYATLDGLYTINPFNTVARPDTTLNNLLKNKYYKPKSIFLGEEGTSNIWNFTDKGLLNLYESTYNKEFTLKHIELPSSLIEGLGVAGFENIANLNGEQYIIGLSEGYVSLTISEMEFEGIPVTIDRVIAIDENKQERLLDLQKPISLEANQNSLILQYALDNHNKFVEPTVLYKLTEDEGWSEVPENATQLVLNNLMPGDYQVSLATRNNEKIYEQKGQFHFSIKKPWYTTRTAIIGYVALVFMLLFFIHKRNEAIHKKRQQRIEKENEEKLRRKKIKAKREVVKLKNEKLKDEISTKNKELATATMNIIKKNEFLNQVKNQLIKVKTVNDVKSVVKTIDKNINNKDDWHQFEKAFNNADKDFLFKIKEKHPALTANDLRLCAYLRLNLSSKEIAPLLNISLRSVEVKRYRLRKKLELPHEANLIDYIINV